MIPPSRRSACGPAGGLAVVAAVGIVAAFWWQGERVIAANGPTFDEAAHLAAGYSYWTTGDFRMNREDPPLLKLWWAIPLVLGERPALTREDSATPPDHWRAGDALLYGSGRSPADLLTPARRMNLAVGCGVVLLAGWWAFRAWGSRLAGLAGCAFAATDPNLLALSCVLSTDVGLTFFGLLACYRIWEYVAAPSRARLLAAGVGLGLMLGAKLSALGIIAGLGVAAGLLIWRGGVLALPGVVAPPGGWSGGSRLRAAIDLAFRLGVIGLITLAVTYGFVHFDEWGRGLKFQLTRTGHGDGYYYLSGELSPIGWYHYYLVAAAVKLPLGLLMAGAGAIVVGLCGRRSVGLCATQRPAGSPVWLLVPPVVFFAAASYSRVDLGIRVVLPAVAFLYVVAARLAAPGCGRVVRLIATAGCLAWAAASGWIAAPYPVAYFNELADMPRPVADSNADWGQGLPALRAYTDRERIEVLYLSFFGTDRPEAYDIRFQPLPGYGRVGPPGGEPVPADDRRHIVAVSLNNLLGIHLNDPETFAWLRHRPPTAILAGSIYVFDLTGDPDAVRRVRAMTP